VTPAIAHAIFDFGENIGSANFNAPSQAYAIRTAVRHNPEDAKRLFKARARMIEPSDFNPENLDRLRGGGSAPSAPSERVGSYEASRVAC